MFWKSIAWSNREFVDGLEKACPLYNFFVTWQSLILISFANGKVGKLQYSDVQLDVQRPFLPQSFYLWGVLFLCSPRKHQFDVPEKSSCFWSLRGLCPFTREARECLKEHSTLQWGKEDLEPSTRYVNAHLGLFGFFYYYFSNALRVGGAVGALVTLSELLNMYTIKSKHHSHKGCCL